MESKYDQNFIAFCDALRAYVVKNLHYILKHTYHTPCMKSTINKTKDGM